MSKYPIRECPHCGCKECLVEQAISGTGFALINLESGDVDISELNDNLEYVTKKKRATCHGCGNPLPLIFRVDNDFEPVEVSEYE